MPAKPYVQQASALLQQAVMTIGSDESEMVRRYESDIQKLQAEISDLETQRNLNAVNLAAHKDDEVQATVARQNLISLEKDKSDKEAQISQLQSEMSQQRQDIQQIKSELQGLAGNVQSALGRSGLV
jgi:predicted  nucleic acid-binding Zn-ribbon protein